MLFESWNFGCDGTYSLYGFYYWTESRVVSWVRSSPVSSFLAVLEPWISYVQPVRQNRVIIYLWCNSSSSIRAASSRLVFMLAEVVTLFLPMESLECRSSRSESPLFAELRYCPLHGAPSEVPRTALSKQHCEQSAVMKSMGCYASGTCVHTHTHTQKHIPSTLKIAMAHCNDHVTWKAGVEWGNIIGSWTLYWVTTKPRHQSISLSVHSGCVVDPTVF